MTDGLSPRHDALNGLVLQLVCPGGIVYRDIRQIDNLQRNARVIVTHFRPSGRLA
jgi:hypothetical protein